jgi:Transposase and inactivated derivatives
MVTKGLKLRIYPNREQRQRLALNFGCTRFVWNQMVAMLNEWHKNNAQAPFLHTYALNNLLPLLQVTNLHLVEAFQTFFKKGKGNPKFKAKRSWKQSYTSKCVNGSSQPMGSHGIRLPKLGILKFKAGSPIPEHLILNRLI